MKRGIGQKELTLKKEKEDQELKELFKSVRKILVKKGLLKKETSPEQKEKPQISEEPKERRRSSRLSLTKDFNKSIILRMNQLNKSENIKAFADNISCGGLCLETKRQLKKNSKINLRLFFYGDHVPMIKIQARIIWKKEIETTNHYGASFNSIEEKDKESLNRYIESNIIKNLS